MPSKNKKKIDAKKRKSIKGYQKVLTKLEKENKEFGGEKEAKKRSKAYRKGAHVALEEMGDLPVKFVKRKKSTGRRKK